MSFFRYNPVTGLLEPRGVVNPFSGVPNIAKGDNFKFNPATGNIASRGVSDSLAPTITGVTATNANGTYGTADTIGIQVVFSEPVIVTGTPQLTLETGTSDAVVNYVSGSGTDTLLFNYTPVAGHGSSDLDVKATNSLTLNGGTIQDAAANNATLTVPVGASAGSLATNKAIIIDTYRNDKSVLLDGVDERLSVGLPANLDFEYTDPFTISCWIKPTNTSQSAPVIAKATAGSGYKGLVLWQSGTNLYTYLINNYGSNALEQSNSCLTAGTWVHLVWTNDGTGSAAGNKLYVDGVLKGMSVTQNTLSASIKDAAFEFKVGQRDSGSCWAGNMDELAVFNTEKSQSDVTALYNAGIPNNLTNVSDMVSYWRMGDTSGDSNTTIIDVAGSNNLTGTNLESGDLVNDPARGFYSAVFNGTSKQTASNHASINFSKTEPFSGGAWVKLDSLPYTGIISKTAPSTSQGFLLQSRLYGEFRFYLLDSATRITFVESSSAMSTNTWYHVGWSYDGSALSSGIKLYLNGALETPAATSDNIVSDINGAADLVVGANDNGTGQYMSGRVNNAFVVSGVLSGADFSAIYGAGVPTSLATYNPLVWLKENNNNTDSGSLALAFTDTNVTYDKVIP